MVIGVPDVIEYVRTVTAEFLAEAGMPGGVGTWGLSARDKDSA